MRIFVRAYGSHLMGMGHLFRVKKIIKALKNKIECEIILFTKNYEEAQNIYNQINVDKIIELNKNITFKDEINILNDIFKQEKFDIVINDELDTPIEIAKILTKIKKSITFDDKGSGNYLFSYIINVLYPTGKNYNNEINDFKYLILDDYSHIKNEIKFNKEVKKIFINQGAADTWGAIPDIITDLNKIEKDFTIKILLGPAFKHFDELGEALKNNKKQVEIFNYVNSVVELVKDCDLAIVGAGNTLFEIASLGIPIIASTREEKELITIKRLLNENIVFGSLDIYKSNLHKLVEEVINNMNERKRKFEQNRKIFTYDGLNNILNLILKD